jgi:hypothetical protein
MLEYTEINKEDCDKISVAVILLNSDNPDENYEGKHHNLALIYHRYIGKYVLLVKEHKLFETDKFIVLKKTKEESERYLMRKNVVRKVIELLNLNPMFVNKRKTNKNQKGNGKNGRNYKKNMRKTRKNRV